MNLTTKNRHRGAHHDLLGNYHRLLLISSVLNKSPQSGLSLLVLVEIIVFQGGRGLRHDDDFP